MTTITLPRAAVEQALALIASARLCEVNSMSSRQEMLRLLIEATDILRAALAQQAEPVSVAAAMRDARLNAGWGSPPQQAEPDHETRAELAEQQVVQLAEERDHYRGLWQKAQQAEPVEPVAWMYTGIKQDGTEHGPHLVWKPEYMDAMSASKGAKATPLYTAPPQRKPLTEEEIERAAHKSYLMGERIWTDDTRKDLIDFARAVERAVERALGIGRQTDPQIADRLARHGIPKP